MARSHPERKSSRREEIRSVSEKGMDDSFLGSPEPRQIPSLRIFAIGGAVVIAIALAIAIGVILRNAKSATDVLASGSTATSSGTAQSADSVEMVTVSEATAGATSQTTFSSAIAMDSNPTAATTMDAVTDSAILLWPIPPLQIPATWWASTSDAGGCQLPTATYSSGFTGAIALGDISTLGQLSYTAGYCGQVFQIDCGSGAVNAVVASTCNLGQGNCGIDMITSTWNAATANAAFGSTSCSVSLTSANPLPGTDAVCYYRPTSDFANAYYKLLGVLNTSGRLVASAALDGIAGSVSSGDWYQFQAGANPFSDASVLVFTYTDGSSSTFALSACAQPSGVQIFS
ncbi:hypothetical protein HDU84_006544 [Entophlyctis sp. JEL0112]|nr:hypothetical protein HDU84_006544 [Entophlyctis sp. JEL0112]